MSEADVVLAQLSYERNRIRAALEEARTLAGQLEAKLDRVDRAIGGLQGVLPDLAEDGALPITDLPAPPRVPEPLRYDSTDPRSRHRTANRNSYIVAVLESGPRDWDLSEVVEEMTTRGWTRGLENPREAIRVALARLAEKNVAVRIEPGKFALRQRLADTQPRADDRRALTSSSHRDMG